MADDSNTSEEIKPKKPVREFQIYDSFSSNDESDDPDEPNKFVMHFFGRTLDDKSVYCKVLNYTPFFYIRIPHYNIKKDMVEYIVTAIKERVSSYNKMNETLIEYDLCKKKLPYGFNDNKRFNLIRLIFNNSDGMKKYFNACRNNEFSLPKVSLKRKIKFETFEANFVPHIKCCHIQNIELSGWVRTSKYKQIKSEGLKESTCDIELNVDWTNLEGFTSNEMAPFKIASFDGEMYCHKISDSVPVPSDKKNVILQIGITYSRWDSKSCYKKFITVLNEHEKFDEDTIMTQSSKEKNLLKKFYAELVNEDCDFIVGYNIFGFDEEYLAVRSMLHGMATKRVEPKFYGSKEMMTYYDLNVQFSKLKRFQTYFQYQKLSSSAIGNSEMGYFVTPGMIHIDLMKYLQRNVNMESYSLDSVSQTFIRGEVGKIEEYQGQYKIYCLDKTIDVKVNDYINIELKQSFVAYNLDKKFKVTFIGSETFEYEKFDMTKNEYVNETCDGSVIFVEDAGIDLTDKINFRKHQVSWTQGKDDVNHKEIFASYQGTPTERGRIAKYCIKDCELVSLLLKKLEIIVNNIQMSNVTHVPFSFLIFRGQGIKIYSLVLKNFAKRGYTFPVLQRKHIDENDEDYEEQMEKLKELEWYEGAIVLDPIPGVYYDPWSTLDYASLYPSSIIHKNISHETIVLDEQYLNLPDYIYYDAEYKEKDGTIIKRKFLRPKDGSDEDKLGNIPLILSNLLKNRKAVKNEMKNEKDEFRKAVLDGKQLALKMTANSLYGQLGAGVSQIYFKDLAACTTSTGREMLMFAKKYSEELFMPILNALRWGDQKTKDFLIETEILKSIRSDPKKMEKIGKTLKYIFDVSEKYKLTYVPIVRYGDSVTGNTPIYFGGRFVEINKIKNKSKKWYDYGDGKEAFDLQKEKVNAWSENGTTKINRIIRHKTNKKIYRIVTPTGFVDVTEDHSLVDKNKNKIKPEECVVKETELLRNYPDTSSVRMCFHNLTDKTEYKRSSQLEAQQLYYYLKSLYYNVYVKVNKENPEEYIVYSDSLNNEQKNVVTEIYDVSDYYYKDQDEIMVYDLETENHHFQAGVGDIIVHNTDSVFTEWGFYQNSVELNRKDSQEIWEYIIRFGRKLLGLFITGEEKQKWKHAFKCIYKNVPHLKFANLEYGTDHMINVLKEFMEEMYLPWLWTLQECYHKSKLHFWKLVNEWSQYIVYKLGLTFYKRPYSYCKHMIFYFVKNIMKKYIFQPYVKLIDGNRVICVKVFESPGKMEDFEKLNLAIKVGVICGEVIKSRLPFPHDLEYEKSFCPFLILSKKKYAGHKFEFDPLDYVLNVMGIELKRRDNPPIVKEVCGGLVDLLFKNVSNEELIDYVNNILKDIRNGKYDEKYFIFSKKLKALENYKEPSKIGHAVLAQRIGERDKGNKPQPGDRIQFCFIKKENYKLLGEIMETPDYIRSNDHVKLDYERYITNQIKEPVLRFLKLRIANCQEFLKF